MAHHHDDAPAAVLPTSTDDDARSPWLTPREVAERARCGLKLVYASIKSGRLRAARLGVRNDLRIHVSWVDAWITSAIVVHDDAPGADVTPSSPFTSRRRR